MGVWDMRRLLLLALCLCFPGSAWSQATADFPPFSLLQGSPEIAILNGEIDARTPLNFRRLLASQPRISVVVLNSPGGEVQSALLVAEDIYERKINTIIIEGSGCYSACALIYFAGSERVAEGELGVHQISGSADIQSAQLNLSDIIEYLSKYGVSAEVITKMLRTPPDQMYVFSQEEIAALGITRVLVPEREETSPQPVPAPSAAPPVAQAVPPSKPEEMAQAFVLGLIMSASLPKNDLIATAKNFYADSVTFYGKVLTQEDVLADKARYADRWPSRASAARVPTIRTFCNGNICRVTGQYDWAVAAPERKASAKGSAQFEYVIDMTAGYRVIAENGKVLDRR